MKCGSVVGLYVVSAGPPKWCEIENGNTKAPLISSAVSQAKGLETTKHNVSSVVSRKNGLYSLVLHAPLPNKRPFRPENPPTGIKYTIGVHAHKEFIHARRSSTQGVHTHKAFTSTHEAFTPPQQLHNPDPLHAQHRENLPKPHHTTTAHHALHAIGFSLDTTKKGCSRRRTTTSACTQGRPRTTTQPSSRPRSPTCTSSQSEIKTPPKLTLGFASLTASWICLTFSVASFSSSP